MIKFPLILLSYFGLFIVSIFSTEDVFVEYNMPAMVAPGSKTLIEITVKKGDVQGFSKLELTLPPGFSASPADIKGASFTFSNQKAKFVWMSLPSDNDFKVTYYLESSDNLEGPYEIDGVFSYVKSNKREDIAVPSKTLIVKKGLQPEPTPEIAEMLPMLKKEAVVVDMICERTIAKVSDTEYIITLRVVNNKIMGFGKILEVLPDNCSTEKINDGGAVITQDEHSIKFVWFEVPVAPSFEISYRLLCTADVSEPVINGQLSYTEDGNPITTNVMQVGSFSSAPLAGIEPVDNQNNNTQEIQQPDNSNTDVAVNSGEPAKTVEPVVTNQNNDASNSDVTNNQTPVVAENTSSRIPVTSVPSAETGITYKVQILAAHRVVNKTYIKDKFNFSEQYNIENHEGWVKYTTGKFDQYKDARDARVKITSESSKLPGPFVTAYNDGERITVQEALLISKQLWYK